MPYRPANQSGPPASGPQPGSLLRRLREAPQDAVNRIAGEIGARRATSLGEAQAAAYLDGRLRRAGLRVSADAFRAPAGVGWDGLALALLAFFGPFEVRLLLWYAQFVAVAYLIMLAVLEAWQLRAPATAGAANHAG